MDEKNTLLIVEDDLDIADMLNAYFRNQGFEVAKRLRENRRTRDIPIIFLTEKRERSDRLRGLELRVDDYITKPFDIQELRLRVQNAIERAGRTSLTDPVTQLPQGSLLDEHLEAALKQDGQNLLMVSLRNLDLFREIYGIVAADDLLRATARMLLELIREQNIANGFVGQYDRANFIVLTPASESSALNVRIRKHIEQSFTYFYSEEDRASGRFDQKSLSLEVHQIQPSTFKQQGLVPFKTELGKFASPRSS